MRIKRAALAIFCSSVLVLTGCASSESDDSPSDDTQNSQDDTSTDQPQQQADVDDLPDVVATVNGSDITRDLFLIDYEVQFDQAVMMSQGAEIDQDTLKLEVAEMIINRELIVQAAAAEGIEATDEDVDEILQGAAAQTGLASVEEFLELGAEQGIDADKMREDAGNQYLINTYIDKMIQVPDAPEDELRAQYDEVVELLKEQGSEPDQIPSFEDVRDQLNDEAKNMQRTEAVDTHLNELRDAAKVEIFI